MLGIDTRQVSGIDKSKIIGLINPMPWGRTLYVRSTHGRADDSHNAGTNPLQPLKTLAKAISLALIDDTIIVGADHVEDIAAATTLAKANVRIIGLGEGRSRPRITFITATTANIKLNAAGILIANMHFRCGIDSQVDMINVAKANCSIMGCMITHNSLQALIAISAVAAADDLLIDGLIAEQTDAGAASCISLVGADRAIIRNCNIQGNYSVANIDNQTTACNNILIHDNYLKQENSVDLLIDLHTDTDGMIGDNKEECADDATAVTAFMDIGNCTEYENYGVNDDGQRGILLGTTSA